MLTIIDILLEALRLATFQPAIRKSYADPLMTASEDRWSAAPQFRTQTEVPAARS
jgi:hypothetical protein